MFMVYILFLSTVVSAEPVLILSFTIYKNDSVSVRMVKFADSTPLMIETESNDYQIDITDREGKFHHLFNTPVTFYVFDLGEVDYSNAYYRFPWIENTKYINFLHNGKVIYSIDISDYICNNNKLCEPKNGENYINCLQDCPSGSADSYCDGIEDGICDPDCSAEEDIDCKEEFPVSYLIGIGSILLVLAYWRLKKREEAKAKKILREIGR